MLFDLNQRQRERNCRAVEIVDQRRGEQEPDDGPAMSVAQFQNLSRPGGSGGGVSRRVHVGIMVWIGLGADCYSFIAPMPVLFAGGPSDLNVFLRA